MKRATMSEAALQRHVVRLLQTFGRPDVCFWHCPNGELRHRNVGAKLKLAGVRAGVADLNLVIDGRFHALELKTEIGALSEAQYLFGEDIERAGGCGARARSGVGRASRHRSVSRQDASLSCFPRRRWRRGARAASQGASSERGRKHAMIFQ